MKLVPYNTVWLMLILSSGCQNSCPPQLSEVKDFDGEGFLLSQDATHTAAVFLPACQIDKLHYLRSLRTKNLGDGVTVALYNFAHTLALMKPHNKFALLNPVDTLAYSDDSIFIAPVRIRYKNLQHGSPIRSYSLDLKLKASEVVKPYIRASQEIETIEFLPYKP